MQKGNKFLIKGMVCHRCITTVITQLETAGLEIDGIGLGEVTFSPATVITDIAILNEKLNPLGFVVLEDKRAKLVKQVKTLVEEVYNGEYDFPYRFRFAELFATKLGKDYDIISSIFSTSENITIEKYIIDYRIQKIKELLVYTDETLADISFKLGFSSVAHLSRQFKEQTGLTPSYFKSLRK